MMCNPPPPTPPTPPPPTPAPNSWKGVAEVFQYAPNSNCDLRKRTPFTPVARVLAITRQSNDPGAQCNEEEDVVSSESTLATRRFVKYQCQDIGPQGMQVVTTQCSDGDASCSRCTGEQKIYSVSYNGLGACLQAGGLGGRTEQEMSPPSVTTDGKISHALAFCLKPPMVKPTPPPAPVKKSEAVPLGVGLGIGLPAIAGGLWFAKKRRAEQLLHAPVLQGGELLQGQTLASTGKGSLGEMYSAL